MKLTVIQQGPDITHVALHGRFDSSGASEIEKDFFSTAVSGGKPLIIDMSDVECIMSNGLRLLISAAKALGPYKAKIALLNPPENVAQAINLVGLDSLLPTAISMDEALKILEC